MKKYVITYDIGTTGIKTCLIEIEDSMRILASATAGYNLYVDDETGVKGGAEQDVDEWWSAMCSTTFMHQRFVDARHLNAVCKYS